MLLFDITTAPSRAAVPAAMTASLINAIGSQDCSRHLLQAMNYVAEFSHCTVFEFRDKGTPAFLGASGCQSSERVNRSTKAYLGRFHCIEPMRSVMHAKEDRIFLRHHTAADLEDDDYRRICYDSVAIIDRLSIVAKARDNSWLIVNLFRDAYQGPLPEDRLNAVSQYASLIVLATRQGLALERQQPDTRANALPMSDNLLTATLSPREKQVCRRILAGMSHAAIAEELGVLMSSVVTFRRRAYVKLDVNNACELRRALSGPGDEH
ncbi:helix-turn-helix transcriptional regulator [Pigmentiphaga litoralis]|uniref:helix-turn-helix transcriptional regulator n=1 Tax=Pigmentiphaga litoralis TaxID=516702 RepID=UPI0038997F18